MPIRESVEATRSAPPPESTRPIPPPLRSPRRLTWLRGLLAPLLGLSVLLHGLLLFAPVPSRPEPVVEEEAEVAETEETVVDLLSISSLADAEPAPPPAETAAAATPPAPTPTAPQAPTQPVVPETYPDNPPSEPSAATESSPADDPLEPDPGAGFDPNRQAQLVSSAVGALGREPGKSNFDLTDQFPGDIWDLYVSQWQTSTRQCFFGSIDRSAYTLRPPAADLRYLSRNIQLVEQQDIPRTFAEQTVQPLGQAYCGFNLFEVQDGGNPILWISLVPVSPGGSTTLVIFWQADPRG
ncbi:hypothetical protein IQ254_30570 [Nodosilinea sp. LEGE 07088]|uniref:hypothetical protein n=1 Tax=Nodosilinea sp. LEGE 07088 TaxID=2777968 RepID=UPI0018801DF3|nr:hypothetical protein [Nodosilinea sp. LEGE 07088]MBE9141483.1 hypothetical protein [Nodosilinea sp. LEGE 07088]